MFVFLFDLDFLLFRVVSFLFFFSHLFFFRVVVVVCLFVLLFLLAKCWTRGWGWKGLYRDCLPCVWFRLREGLSLPYRQLPTREVARRGRHEARENNRQTDKTDLTGFFLWNFSRARGGTGLKIVLCQVNFFKNGCFLLLSCFRR